MFFTLLFSTWMFACKILCKWWIRQKLMDDLIYHLFWQVLRTFSFWDKVAGQVQFSDTFLRTCCTPVSFCSRVTKTKIHYRFHCLYGHVFITVRYSCYTSFLCSCKHFLEQLSQFKVQVHNTQTSAGDEFHFCFVRVIKFVMFLVNLWSVASEPLSFSAWSEQQLL